MTLVGRARGARVAMDDLLSEFLAEAAEHIDAASMQLVRIEKDPGNPALIASLFRHVHTIKGSSGFLSLPRVGRLAHGAEALIGRLRDGAKASGEHISSFSRSSIGYHRCSSRSAGWKRSRKGRFRYFASAGSTNKTTEDPGIDAAGARLDGPRA